ncbi:FAD-dependent oxidoreductase [Spongiibacter nanhainus]|uniref:FAD-dependent oxidoreductase n=1 Tax=Spongiibacter nanhainus TaxID=2794344 RepID=A0A7T4URP9_9GAMM|nr:FAD-dependent oxidoreductase [Spongiibacter nanhainus]QQD19956.1 FAD-dependent oxidoreductase [Spongiibacter nanhainus]
MKYTHVNTPLKIGPVEIKNRIVRPAHGTLIGQGSVNDNLIAYHEERAKGGVALSIIEIMGVHPSSLGALNSYDPSLEESYPKLVDACHMHGMKVFQQLWHGGHNIAMPSVDGSPPWSASAIRGLHSAQTPTPMTLSMIKEIIASFEAGARKCEEWGVDGVEIHCAHGYLPAQFLSPAINQRDDEYGGSLENRARFIIELVAAVRAAVSPNIAVGVRVAPDTLEGGAGLEDYQYIVKTLEEKKLIDYVNISLGNYQTFPKMIGGMHEPAGYEMDTSSVIAASTDLPTIVVGRFRTLEEADQLIRSGDADMVGMVRALIADPNLVAKSLDDRADDVRPCIGCNQGCVAGIYKPIMPVMGCTVNPAVGLENFLSENLIQAAQQTKKVVVIGGGPAGMEAARVAALRGHTVSLFEANKELGGKLRYAALAPTRAGIRDIAVWQEEQLYKHGVDVHLNSFVEMADITTLNPDMVIVAVGATPRSDGKQLSNPGEEITLINNAQLKTSVELFEEGKDYSGKDVTVIDDLGEYEAIACAEYLLSMGANVNYVTRHTSFAPYAEYSLMTEPALKRLYGERFTLHLRSRVTGFDGQNVAVLPTYIDRAEDGMTVAAAEVFYISSGTSNSEYLNIFNETTVDIKYIGDARSSRSLVEAIADGYKSTIFS